MNKPKAKTSMNADEIKAYIDRLKQIDLIVEEQKTYDNPLALVIKYLQDSGKKILNHAGYQEVDIALNGGSSKTKNKAKKSVLKFARNLTVKNGVVEKTCYPIKSESKQRPHKIQNKSSGSVKNKPSKVTRCSELFVASNEFLQSYEWRKLRLEVLKRDGAKCACCGATPDTGAVMNVDHIKPRKRYPELALDINNLQVLCHECNHGKGNWDETDFRK